MGWFTQTYSGGEYEEDYVDEPTLAGWNNMGLEEYRLWKYLNRPKRDDFHKYVNELKITEQEERKKLSKLENLFFELFKSGLCNTLNGQPIMLELQTLRERKKQRSILHNK